MFHEHCRPKWSTSSRVNHSRTSSAIWSWALLSMEFYVTPYSPSLFWVSFLFYSVLGSFFFSGISHSFWSTNCLSLSYSLHLFSQLFHNLRIWSGRKACIYLETEVFQLRLRWQMTREPGICLLPFSPPHSHKTHHLLVRLRENGHVAQHKDFNDQVG